MGKWRADAMNKGVQRFLGNFERAEDAACAYDDFLRKEGTSVRLLRRVNFPTPSEAARLSVATPCVALRSRRAFEVEAISKRVFADGLDRSAWDLEWMPEGTRADGALRPRALVGGDSWFGIQMKATATSHAGRPNAYSFTNLRGYGGLLIVCIALDACRLWVLPGVAVDSPKLTITIGGKWDRYRCSWGHLGAVLACAWMCRDTFFRRSLASLRLPRSREAQVEVLSLDRLGQALVEVGLCSSPPPVQGGSIDMLVDTSIRVQCKSRTAPTIAVDSFRIVLARRCGMSKNVPYSTGDFDVLLACLIVGERLVGVFVIPARELLLRGHFCPITWRTSLTLYLPWAAPKMAKARVAKEWQAEYFVSTDGGLDEVEKARLRHLMLQCRTDLAICP